MSYSYPAEKAQLFTDEGQRNFLKIRDAAKKLLNKAGAFQMSNVLDEAAIGGDSWFQLACVDRLVELGELSEVTPTEVAGQCRIFAAGPRWREY